MEKQKYGKNIVLALFGFFAGFINGLFGSGGGMIVVPVLERYAHTEPKKAHATAIGVILPLTVVSIIKYMKFGKTDPLTLTLISVGGVAGSILGARLLKKFTNDIIRRVFAVIILITALRMVI